MVEQVRFVLDEVEEPFYPLPDWVQELGKGLVHAHQWTALTTDDTHGRIHAPTGTGKSRAAAFYCVSPYLRGEQGQVRATFAYPTNLLTRQQYDEALLTGLVENLGFSEARQWTWQYQHSSGPLAELAFPCQRSTMPTGEDLFIAQLTGELLLKAISACEEGHVPRKTDILLEFMSFLNQRHSFLVASPDLMAYAAHEMYGAGGMYYWKTKKRRLSNMLRGRTLVLDEYHMYDPFTLINLERLLDDGYLRPSRVLLLSATPRKDYFPTIPHDLTGEPTPTTSDQRIASRLVDVCITFSEMPEPVEPDGGLSIWIHNSVVDNRRRATRLRAAGIPVTQWDGTRKEQDPEASLVLGTSAIEVGLHLPEANELHTEWWRTWNTPGQLIQRIGRVGRVEGKENAKAHVYITSKEAIPNLEVLTSLEGSRVSKEEFMQALSQVSPPSPVYRKKYVSYYFDDRGSETRRKLEASGLQPRHELQYSFRTPGTQGLFVDDDGQVFLYDRSSILRRYEVVPCVPEDDVPLVWQRMAEGLGIPERHWYTVGLERTEPDYTHTLATGLLEDLGKPSLRWLYVKNGDKKDDGGSQFI